MNYSHYSLQPYIPAERMPLWVIHIPKGKHLQRNFHDHTFSEIVLILDGTALHLLNGEKVTVKAGDLLVIHPGYTHAYDQTGELELINIIYDSRKLFLPVLDGYSLPLFRYFFPDGSEPVNCTAKPLLQLNQDEQRKLIGMIHEMDTELRESHLGCGLYSLSLLIEIIVTVCRLAGAKNQEKLTPFRIGEVLSYMNTHYQQSVSIDSLARRACMSRRNFFLQFKSTTGCSPVQYLVKLRIMHASELLLYSALSIGDIAWKCGFSDGNYFCRKFREGTGVSPRRFRLKHRSET